MRLRDNPRLWPVIFGIILTLYIIAGAVAAVVHITERTWL